MSGNKDVALERRNVDARVRVSRHLGGIEYELHLALFEYSHGVGDDNDLYTPWYLEGRNEHHYDLRSSLSMLSTYLDLEFVERPLQDIPGRVDHLISEIGRLARMKAGQEHLVALLQL